MRRLLTALGILLLVAAKALAESGKCLDLAADGTGRIWAAMEEKIAFFDTGGDWQDLAAVPKLAQTLRPQLMQTLPTGEVACLWSETGRRESHAVTLHRGKKSRLWATFDVKLKEPRLLGRDDGSLLITEQGPSVVILAAEKTSAKVLTLPAEVFHPPEKPSGDSGETIYAPVRALEDDARQVWLWSYALDRGGLRLKGLVSFDGGTFQPRNPAGIAADASLSDVAAADPDWFWVGVVGVGLFRLDLTTFRAEEVPQPVRGNFTYISRFFQAASHWHMVTVPRPTSVTFDEALVLHTVTYYDQTKHTSDLWRFSDEKWNPILVGIDAHPDFGRYDRPVLEMPAGVFVGSNGSGAWLLPAKSDGKPIAFDWRQAFPCPVPKRFCPAGKGALMTLSSDREIALASAKPKTPEPRGGQITVLRFSKRLLLDPQAHLWGFRAGRVFSEWDGKIWINHSVPAALQDDSWTTDFESDNRGRGWLIRGDGGTTGIWDFASKKWEVFETFARALEAQLPSGVYLSIPQKPYLEPIFTSDGRIAFLNLLNGLSFFDGAAWRTWKIAEVAGSDARIEGGPYFDAERRPCLPVGGDTFKLVGKDEWQRFSQPDAPKHSMYPRKEEIELPQDFPLSKPSSVARDQFGVFWLTSPERDLYKAVPGTFVSVLEKDEPNPFMYGAQVYEALVDSEGNAFLCTTGDYSGYAEYVFVPARPPDLRRP